MRNASSNLTSLLNLARKGDKEACEALWPQIYAELLKIAEIHFARSRRDETVRPTALVNEVFLRLTSGAEINFNNRVHFFATAARAMRFIIADHAR